MILPTNVTEAREVLTVEIRAIILANFRKVEGKSQLNATRATEQITDLVIDAYKALKSAKNA